MHAYKKTLDTALRNIKMPKRQKVVKDSFEYVRNRGMPFKFGAHVKTAGGIYNSVTHAMNIGGNSFALFLKSPRRWVSPPLKDEDVEKFKKMCEQYGYDTRKDILPHGSYFINLANPDKAKNKQSVDCFIDDLQRCEKLDIGMYNFHPGSSLGTDHDEAVKRLAENINYAISKTKFVKIVVENMAGHGNLIASTLDDLSTVLKLVEKKERLGFCIDTCHTFAAGYDISTERGWNTFWDEFDKKIGFEHLASMHLNDSKAPLGANKDRHERIGWGFLGLECFRLLANDDRMKGIPLVLEVPIEGKDDVSPYGDDIKLLEWLVGKKSDSADFLKKVEELQKLGAPGRKEQLVKFEKKKKKEATTRKRKATGKNGDIASMLKRKKK